MTTLSNNFIYDDVSHFCVYTLVGWYYIQIIQSNAPQSSRSPSTAMMQQHHRARSARERCARVPGVDHSRRRMRFEVVRRVHDDARRSCDTPPRGVSSLSISRSRVSWTRTRGRLAIQPASQGGPNENPSPFFQRGWSGARVSFTS